jgi:hypothetical protein
MTIQISNESASAFVRGYAHTEDGLLVWLEMAPHHPKVVGAIWASLVNGHRTYLQLRDQEKGIGKPVCGLGHAYIRLEMDAPALAVGFDGESGRKGMAQARLLRLIAPESIRPQTLEETFFVLAWPGISPATVLAATLEKTAPFPVQIGWGEYLLDAALERETARPLITGGSALPGYEIQPTDWMTIISEGLQQERIHLQQERIQ